MIMIAKSALFTTALLASTQRALSFSPIITHTTVYPVITATSPASSRAISTPTSTSTTTLHALLNNNNHNDDPHLQTRPLPPPSSSTPTTTTSSSPPAIFQKIRLRLGFAKHLRERVVHKYFHGVDTKNISQIIECFHSEGAVIRDICSLSNRDASYEDVGKLVTPDFLGERCREFLAAHPDAKVMFHHGPTCGRGRNNKWVYAHWYETGSWSGTSQGIDPDGSPLTVQGQTRFLVDDDLKIKEIVITRTFSRWEEMLLLKGK
mmetsp:Transcript_25788/g.46723  ORF Transcript_25788/g.46723 Transcript_25788/m.46723 type:complete len:263 (-) Transcript_25788:325-1113(-)|eukprot:CAMPEP_0196132948 /NCGR_PEP_ID=MMETSP0910-20130528/2370_1 /TAXON_ID=49265 /ORGANISM="Thalassiosira rotula, Strain GSO102" /LENGTH=262 /DNA_ID=CAMNT_0041392611 /DNA_START=21 /DNA_END=809 /DNA_ORIENTATION=-